MTYDSVGISFDGEAAVVHDVSFSLTGRNPGLVGESGSGKVH